MAAPALVSISQAHLSLFSATGALKAKDVRVLVTHSNGLVIVPGQVARIALDDPKKQQISVTVEVGRLPVPYEKLQFELHWEEHAQVVFWLVLDVVFGWFFDVV